MFIDAKDGMISSHTSFLVLLFVNYNWLVLTPGFRCSAVCSDFYRTSQDGDWEDASTDEARMDDIRCDLKCRWSS